MNTKEINVKVPESLFLNLTAQAISEGVTLEEIVVYALTRQTTPAYQVREMTDEDLQAQERRHSALIQSLRKNNRQISIEEAKKILSEREQIEPESKLGGKTIEKLKSVL
jgi:hypothetical protein